MLTGRISILAFILLLKTEHAKSIIIITSNTIII